MLTAITVRFLDENDQWQGGELANSYMIDDDTEEIHIDIEKCDWHDHAIHVVVPGEGGENFMFRTPLARVVEIKEREVSPG